MPDTKPTMPELLFEVFLDLGLGDDPEQGGEWPMYIGTMPDAKQAIAFTDIGLPTQGRARKQTIGFKGVQVRVSSKTYSASGRKMAEFEEACDDVLRKEVAFGNDRYVVHAIHQLRQSVYIGQDENDRDSFTLDIVSTARKVT